jgi:hypothetical protein
MMILDAWCSLRVRSGVTGTGLSALLDLFG